MQPYRNYIAGFNSVYPSGQEVLHYNPVMPMLY